MKKRTKRIVALLLFILISFAGGMWRVYKTIPKPIEESIPNLLVDNVYATTEEEPTTYIEPTWDIVEEPIEEECSPETTTYSPEYNEETIEVLTNLLYGEARGVKEKSHQAGVIWCVLNRYDNGHYGKTIIEVATAKNQFCGYVKDREYKDLKAYEQCREIVIDVLDRYYTEEQIGRVLPKDYLYFMADKSGLDNNFTNKWKGTDYWDWSLPNPYTE